MNQDVINTILPDLYMAHSLVLDYNLANPEFYVSIYSKSFNYVQSIAGILLIAILFINYTVKSIITCPNEALTEYAQILPHLSALKAPIFIIYPLFPEEIGFCFGFMVS
jgi:hypothetical protein